MGYNTQYSLSVSGPTEAVKQFRQDYYDGKIVASYDVALADLAGLDAATYKCKWYEWIDDIKAISTQYPLVLIELTGIGEDVGDYWKAYNINGIQQIVEGTVTYPEPNQDIINAIEQAIATETVFPVENTKW